MGHEGVLRDRKLIKLRLVTGVDIEFAYARYPHYVFRTREDRHGWFHLPTGTWDLDAPEDTWHWWGCPLQDAGFQLTR